MAEEFASAFRDVQRDAANSEKLVDLVRSHYAKSLNPPEFCSVPKRRRLSPANDLIPPFVFHSFLRDLYRLYSEHLMLYEKLKSMDECLRRQLRCIAVCKWASAAFFIAATAICAVAAAADKADAGSAAGGASLLFGAVGKLIHFLLIRRETAVKRHEEIAKLMIMGDKIGMKELCNIHAVAVAKTASFEELQRRVEYYIGEMKWVKQLVIESIIKP